MAGGAITIEALPSIPDRDALKLLSTLDPGASVYHESRWLEAIERTYALPAFHLAARAEGTLRGFLPLFEMRSILGERVGVSSPFSNYGGPIATDRDVAGRLLDAAAEIAHRRNWSYLEVKSRRSGAVPAGWTPVGHFCSPVLDLSGGDPDRLWREALEAKTRNQVRKASRGLELGEGTDDVFDDVLRVYHRAMRDLGTPGHGPAWFENLRELLPSRIVALVARQRARPVGGALLIEETSGGVLQYCLSLKPYLSLCPNNLLYWGAINLGIRRGWRYLDFGRSRREGGTYRFKLQWGATPIATPYIYHLPPSSRRSSPPDLHPSNPAFRALIETWKVLPVRVTRVIGPRLRPHITT